MSTNRIDDCAGQLHAGGTGDGDRTLPISIERQERLERRPTAGSYGSFEALSVVLEGAMLAEEQKGTGATLLPCKSRARAAELRANLEKNGCATAISGFWFANSIARRRD
jgi:hypothetical protein